MMEKVLHPFLLGLGGGVLGFAHCLGMCGGFVLLAGQGRSRLAGELQWLLGKLYGYLLLGAVAGFAGRWLGGVLGGWASFQTAMAVLVGCSLVLAALTLLGLVPTTGGGPAPGGIVTLCAARLGAGSAPGGALFLGVLAAFLPCPVLLPLLLWAMREGSVAAGMAAMAGLGVGTSLPLLVLGAVGRRTAPALRRWIPRLTGVLLLLLGVATVLRGTPFLHHLMGGAPHRALNGHREGAPPIHTEGRHGGDRQ